MDGFITQAENGLPLQDALVELTGGSPPDIIQTTVTRENGAFVLANLCPGKEYTLTVRFIGFQSAVRSLKVSNNSYHLDISLQPMAHVLDELEVEGKRRPGLDDSRRRKLSERDIAQQSGKTLGEAMGRVPGVTLLRTGPTIVKPMIHGMQGHRVLILNQGIRHEGQQWGNDHAPEIDPLASGQISVVKGAAAVRYGADAMGGVIVTTPPALPDSAHFGGRVNLTGASNNRLVSGSSLLTLVPARIPALAFQANGSYRRAGDARAPDYILSNTGLKEWNAGYRIAYRKQRSGLELAYNRFATTLGVLYASHAGNATDLREAIASSRPKEVYRFTYAIKSPYQKASHELVTLKANHSFTEQTRLDVQVARQFNKRSEFDRHSRFGEPDSPDAPSVAFNLETWSADATVSHSFSQHLELQTEVSYYLGRKTGNFDASSRRFLLRSLIPNYSSGLASAWAFLEGERWYYRFGLGARADLKNYDVQEGSWAGEPSKRQFFNPGASLSIARGLGQHLSVDGVLSFSGRSPTIAELYSRGLHHGLATIEIGTPRLDRETQLSASMGWKLDFHHLQFRTNWYINRFQNYINLLPDPPGALTAAGYFPVYRYRGQDITIMGSDWEGRWDISKAFSLSGSAGLLRARESGSNRFVQQMPSDRCRLELAYAKKGFEVELSGQWVGKQWRLPSNLLSDTLDFAPPPAGYFLLGFSASWTFDVGSIRPTVGLEAVNLLDQRYRDYLDRFRYFADSQGRNIMLRLSIPFNLTQTQPIK